MNSEPRSNVLPDGSSEEGGEDTPKVGGRCDESYIALGPEGHFQELSDEEEGEGYSALSNLPAGREESCALENAASEAAGSSCYGSSCIDGLGVDESLLGERVVLQGLQAKPELNGCTGVVLSFDASQGRYAVKLDVFGALPPPEADQGTVKLLKASNLVLHENPSADDVNEEWGAFTEAAVNESSRVTDPREAQACGMQTQEEVSAKLLKRMNADWERTVAAADAATAEGNVNGAPRRLNVQYSMRQASSAPDTSEEAPTGVQVNATSAADSTVPEGGRSSRAGLLHKVAGRRWEDNPLDSDAKDAIRAAMAKVILKAPPPRMQHKSNDAVVNGATAVTAGDATTASDWATDFDFSRADAPAALKDLGFFQLPQLPQPKSRLKKEEPIPAFANFDDDTPPVPPPPPTDTTAASSTITLDENPSENSAKTTTSAGTKDAAGTEKGVALKDNNNSSASTLVAAAGLHGMCTLVHLDLRPVGAPASGDTATRAVLLGACAQVRNLRAVGLSAQRGAFGAAAREEAVAAKATGSVLFLAPSSADSQAPGSGFLPAVVPAAWAYNVRLLAARLSASETCQSAHCIFVDFGEASPAGNTSPTAAEKADMAKALAEQLGAAVVKLCAKRGGVKVVVRGSLFPPWSSKNIEVDREPPSSEWGLPPAELFQAAGDDGRSEIWWVHPPCRSRDTNASADLLAAEEVCKRGIKREQD